MSVKLEVWSQYFLCLLAPTSSMCRLSIYCYLPEFRCSFFLWHRVAVFRLENVCEINDSYILPPLCSLHCLCVVPQEGETPLHVAAKRGHVKVVEQLCHSGSNVHNADSVGSIGLFLPGMWDSMHDTYRKSHSFLSLYGEQRSHPIKVFVHRNLQILIKISDTFCRTVIQKIVFSISYLT